MRYLCVILLVVVSLSVSLPAGAQSLAVAGRIVDAQGAVVVEAAIILERAAGSPWTTSSSGDGTFSISGVPAGMYTLRVRAAGFAEWTQALTVSAATANVTVTLA